MYVSYCLLFIVLFAGYTCVEGERGGKVINFRFLCLFIFKFQIQIRLCEMWREKTYLIRMRAIEAQQLKQIHNFFVFKLIMTLKYETWNWAMIYSISALLLFFMWLLGTESLRSLTQQPIHTKMRFRIFYELKINLNKTSIHKSLFKYIVIDCHRWNNKFSSSISLYLFIFSTWNLLCCEFESRAIKGNIFST